MPDTTDDVPLSQDQEKITRASKRNCIAELRRIAELDPTKVVTRNYFRNESPFAESAWSEHFGTFTQFKRSAGITLSRHAHRMELDVAKHAGVERMKSLNTEKRGWEGRYQRPDRRRFQTHVVVSDLHDRECDPFLRRVLMETILRVQPTRLILGGDSVDLPEFGRYGVDPREWDVVARIRWLHEFLAEARRVSPNSRIDMIEGNHEVRLLRHLAEATPAMRAILADLHGFTVPRLLGLDAYEVNYLARADLATFTATDIRKEVARNYLIADDAYVVHHFPEGMRLGYPGMHGHHHRLQVWNHFSPKHGAYNWYQLGAGHRRAASYCDGEKWQNGFMLVHLDTTTKHVSFEYIDIRDHAVVGGRWYMRGAKE